MEMFSFVVYLFLLFTQIRKDLIGVHTRHITMEHEGGQSDSLFGSHSHLRRSDTTRDTWGVAPSYTGTNRYELVRFPPTVFVEQMKEARAE